MDHGEYFIKNVVAKFFKKPKMMGLFQSLKHNAIWKEFVNLFPVSHWEPLCCFADTGHSSPPCQTMRFYRLSTLLDSKPH